MNPRIPNLSSIRNGLTEQREPGIEIECYESLGGHGPGKLSLSVETLKRHIFVVGATGSGKSTLLRSLMRELIALRACDPEGKVGLLILDLKNDDTPTFVRTVAASVGRSKDVRVLSLESATGYDFFADCRSLNDVSEFTQRLTFGCGRVDARDNFWDQYRDALLSAGLTWLVLNHPENRAFVKWIGHMSAWLLADRMPEEMKDDLGLLREKCDQMPLGSPERIATRHSLQLIDEWDSGMDYKTRANVKSTLHIALRPLMEPAALRLFRDSPFRKFKVSRVVERGQILVVSLNGFLNPALTQLIAKIVKAEYYSATLARKQGGRLAMLFADEFQLAVTSSGTATRYDDCLALPLLRSFNAGVIAATQTLAGIDRVIGNLGRRVLLGNFCTTFFMRSTERETNEWANQVCGSVDESVTRSERVRDVRGVSQYPEEYERRITGRVRRAVCGLGALARLETGQAYLLQEGVSPSRHPVWIAEAMPEVGGTTK